MGSFRAVRDIDRRATVTRAIILFYISRVRYDSVGRMGRDPFCEANISLGRLRPLGPLPVQSVYIQNHALSDQARDPDDWAVADNKVERNIIAASNRIKRR